MIMKQWWNSADREHRSARRKNYTSAILTTTNPTCKGLKLNQGVRSEKLAYNRLTLTRPYSTN